MILTTIESKLAVPKRGSMETALFNHHELTELEYTTYQEPDGFKDAAVFIDIDLANAPGSDLNTFFSIGATIDNKDYSYRFMDYRSQNPPYIAVVDDGAHVFGHIPVLTSRLSIVYQPACGIWVNGRPFIPYDNKAADNAELTAKFMTPNVNMYYTFWEEATGAIVSGSINYF